MQNTSHVVHLSPPVLLEEQVAWKEIFHYGKEYFWSKNSQVFKPNIDVGGFHYVIDGLFRSVSITIDGRQKTLWVTGSNVLLGEVAMFCGAFSIYTVECEQQGSTIFFDRTTFYNKILPYHPTVLSSILRILAIKTRMQSEDALAWNFLPVWKRVGEFLLKVEKSPHAPILLRHREIADFLGIHRVTASKALLKLCEQGVIINTTNSISIVNREKLVELVKKE